MKASVELYQKLKKKADEAKTDADRAEGSLENQLKKLKEEFGCETVEAAQKMAVELKGQLEEEEASFEEELRRFQEKWGDALK